MVRSLLPRRLAFAFALAGPLLAGVGCSENYVVPADNVAPGGDTTQAPTDAPASTAPEDPDYIAGLQALEQSDPAAALEAFDRVQPDSKDYAAALSAAVQALEQTGNFEAASERLDRLVQYAPDNPSIRLGLSYNHFRQGNYEQAELNALRAVEIAPRSFQPRYQVGLARMAQGDAAGAVSAYARAIEADTSGAYVAKANQEVIDFTRQHPEHPESFYVMAFFGETLRIQEQEIEGLEGFLAVRDDGLLADMARAQLEKIR